MDRGPSGPHSTCAANRKQRVDMQSMWRQGSLRHPSPTLRRLWTLRVRASESEQRVTFLPLLKTLPPPLLGRVVLTFVLIRQGLRGGSEPQLYINAAQAD